MAILLLPILLSHARITALPRQNIDRVAVGREWKIEDLALPQ